MSIVNYWWFVMGIINFIQMYKIILFSILLLFSNLVHAKKNCTDFFDALKNLPREIAFEYRHNEYVNNDKNDGVDG